MPLNGHAPDDWVTAALHRYETPLVHYAQRITGDAERARDVVQETFLKLWQEPRESVDGHLAQWLYTVCRNQALDVRRKESRMVAVSDPPVFQVDDRQPNPARVEEAREEVHGILELMNGLPVNQQECIRLKLQHGLSYREISGVTGLSVSNVGFLIHTGLKTLRAKVSRRQSLE